MAIAQILQNDVQTAIANYAIAPLQSGIGFLLSIAMLCTTLYILFLGFAIANGSSKMSMSELIWRLAKMTLILALALSINFYQDQLFPLLRSLEGAMIEWLYDSTRVSTGRNAGTIGNVIDQNVAFIEALARTLYEKASAPDIQDLPLMSAALLATFCHIAMVAGSLIPLLAAKVTLQLLFAIGPLFLFFAIWPITQRYTIAWLNATLTAILTVGVVMVIINILPMYAGEYTRTVFWSTLPSLDAQLTPPDRLEDVLNKLGELTIIVLICLWIIWRVAGFFSTLLNSTIWQQASHKIVGYIAPTYSSHTHSNVTTNTLSNTHETTHASLAQQHVINHIHKN